MASSFDFNIPNSYDGLVGRESPSPPPQIMADALNQPPSRAPGHVTVYHTTGPDAYTGPILTPGSNTPALNPRSCVTCRRRKVRCDKQMPCSNCRRALIPCIFPAPGRAPRQPRPKDPNAPPKNTTQREFELVKRLKKLEGIVEELSGQIEVESGGKGPSATGSPEASQLVSSAYRRTSAGLDMTTSTGNSPKTLDLISESGSDMARGGRDLEKKMGRLVVNDHKGSTRYVSSVFWAKLNDELDDLREETQRLTDNDSDEYEDDATPDQSPAAAIPTPVSSEQAFILGYSSSNVDLLSFHPHASHVPFLWSVYQENVETLVKVLHVPSTESIIREARGNPAALSPANEALVFGIYFSAVVSLEPDEVETNFNQKKDDLVSKYRFALEQSLAKAKFLNTSDLAVLTALILFLTVVRRYDRSRFTWSLTGLVVRIAQGMGLHRDGSKLKGLSALEVEMRRRTWWAILSLDYQSSEEMGSDPTITPGSFDTEMPGNINDADIGPHSIEIPPSREGRSDCAVPLIKYEICTISREFITAAANSNGSGLNEATIDEREKMLIQVYSRLESKFVKHVVDEADPLYWVAAMIARIIMAKMCLVIYQPMLFPGSGHDLSEKIRDRIFVAAIEIVEYNYKLNSDPRCKQFRWLFATYTNWHAIAYALVEICRRQWTALIERAWESVANYDRDSIEYAKNSDHVAVFLPMRRLFVRARKHRIAEIARLKAQPDEARRLDFAERMNPTQARFGLVPGTENTMELVREKWWSLVRPDNTSPAPFSQHIRTPVTPFADLPAGDVSRQPPATHLQVPQQVPGQLMSNGNTPQAMDMATAAVDLVDEVISQPNVTMADFWPLQMMAGAGPGSAIPDGGMMGVPQGAPMRSPHLVQGPNGAVLHQQQQMGALPPDDNPPPFLWNEYPVQIADLKGPQAYIEDTDMLGENFDWQDWSQSIRGLEMGSAP